MGNGGATVMVRWGRTLRCGIASRPRVALGVGACLIAAAAGSLVWLAYAPLPPAITHPSWSRAIFDNSGRLLDVHIAADEQWRLPLADHPLPPKYLAAVLTFEDQHFFRHPGVNPCSIVRAAVENVQGRQRRRGGSTITMQLARLALGNLPRTYGNKLRELAVALQLELRLTKQVILRSYAQLAPFGGNLVGLQAASLKYFGRSPDELSWSEAALLAVLPNSPGLLYPGRNTESLRSKRNLLLTKLYNAHYIDGTDLRLAQLEPIPIPAAAWPDYAPHLLDRLALESPDKPVLHTTIDGTLQRSVRQVLNHHALSLAAAGIQNAAAVVIDHTTLQVRAYLGNVSTTDSADPFVDIAASPRSTGSILKPLLYGLLLQEGSLLPTTLVPDIPTLFGTYAPQNYDQNYRGAIPAAQMVAQSLNVPAVRLLHTFGVDRFRERLSQCGLTTINRSAEDYGLSLILGGAEASLWELTALYANLTHVASTPMMPPYRQQPHFTVGEYRGAQSESTKPFPLQSGAAWLTLQAMTQVVRPGSDMFWRDYEQNQVIAWKTGTSFGLRDAWAIGSNGRYTVGVWAGNANGSPAAALSGTETAGPLLLRIFERLGDSPWIPKPHDALTSFTVCGDDGYHHTDACQPITTLGPKESVFLKPTPYHQRIFLSPDGRFRVHSGCESPLRMQPVSWFVLPPTMEFYWRAHHREYRQLPPWREDCVSQQGDLGGDHALEMVYPSQHTAIVIPLDLDGTLGRSIFRAIHRDDSATVYWHLDDHYLGETTLFHERMISASPGQHHLVLVDARGHRLERSFRVAQ